jgi:hypothetical protein
VAWTFKFDNVFLGPSSIVTLPQNTKSEVWVQGVGGSGSTNVTCRYFPTVNVNTGSAITYSSSTTLGDSWTINEAGVYAITYNDFYDTAQAYGITKNNTGNLSTNVDSASPISNVLGIARAASTVESIPATAVVSLAVGDVIRAQAQAATPHPSAIYCSFRITKVASSSSLATGGTSSEVYLDTGNGFGSTNTRIRRFFNIRKNIGSAITYTDSATLGATFTINESGVYSASIVDRSSGNNIFGGMSINGNVGSDFQNSANDGLRMLTVRTANAGDTGTGSGACYLSAGDVLRVQFDSGSKPDDNANAIYAQVRIAKVNTGSSINLGGPGNPRSQIDLDTYVGYGSTNTRIPYFSTSAIQGTDMSLTSNSSTLGAAITINVAGVYSMSFLFGSSISGNAIAGITVNSTNLSSSVISLSYPERIALQKTGAISGDTVDCMPSTTRYLNVGDVIRPHTTAAVPATAAEAHFTITKVSN